MSQVGVYFTVRHWLWSTTYQITRINGLKLRAQWENIPFRIGGGIIKLRYRLPRCKAVLPCSDEFGKLTCWAWNAVIGLYYTIYCTWRSIIFYAGPCILYQQIVYIWCCKTIRNICNLRPTWIYFAFLSIFLLRLLPNKGITSHGRCALSDRRRVWRYFTIKQKVIWLRIEPTRPKGTDM